MLNGVEIAVDVIKLCVSYKRERAPFDECL